MAQATGKKNGETQDAEQPATAAVSANPALVQFPTDEYGITTAFRKAAILSAARVRGDDAKYETFMAVLRVIALHMQARHEGDKHSVKAHAKALNERELVRMQPCSSVTANSHRDIQK